MSTICAELEEVGHSGELERAPMLREYLEGEFERVSAAFQEELSKS